MGALSSIVEQINYTNLFLQSMGKQATRIENILHKTLKYMLMYAQAALIQGNDEPHILTLITLGFTRELAGWWDDHLTDEQRTAIRSATTLDHTSMDQLGNLRMKPDMINTLMCMICLHFIVFQKKYSNMNFWKERFIAGLPSLFEEREQCDCDHYKSILKLNGLSINVLKKEDNLILDCIDAIDDPEKKRSALEKYIAMAQEQKILDNEELKEMKKQMQTYELYHLEAFGKQDSVKDDEDSFANMFEAIKVNEPSTSQLNSQLNHEEDPPAYSKITIVVSKTFIFEGEALIDLGADLNCISEGIIPS
ncbi:hypothetical protein ACOSQ4_007098 [Xanthoceras sorbifolium]